MFGGSFAVAVTTEPLPTLLSSRAEVESIFSEIGIKLRIDDDLDGVTDGTGGTANDTQKLIDALVEASDEGYENLWQYKPEDLALSLWVRRRVSYIACHLISIRKGNPGQYCDKYEQYLQQFKDVRRGKKQIPRLAKTRLYTATMSNVVVDHWHGYQKLRTMTEASEGATDPRQFEDRIPFRGYYGWWF